MELSLVIGLFVIGLVVHSVFWYFMSYPSIALLTSYLAGSVVGGSLLGFVTGVGVQTALTEGLILGVSAMCSLLLVKHLIPAIAESQRK